MKHKKSIPWFNYAFIGIVFGFVLLINYHANRRFVRVDLTANKMYTIAPATKALLRSLSDYLTVELYFSEDLPTPLQKVKDDVADIVDEFKVYGGDKLKIDWRVPRVNSIDKQSAISLGIEQISLPIVENDRQSIVKTFAGVAVRYAGRTEVIPLVRGTKNFEYELIKRISMVLRDERPRVGIFRTDAYSDQDLTKQLYKGLFDILEKEYTVEYIDVQKTFVIDPSISTLIVPGGDDLFFSNPFAVAAIDQYFMKGGKLIVLANRIDVNLARSAVGKKQNSPLFDMLKKYGVEVEPYIIADYASNDKLQMQQEIEGKMQTYPMDYPFFMKLTREGIVSENPALTGFSEMVLPWSSPLKVVDSLPESVVVDTLLMSSETAFTMGEPYKLNPRVYWDKRLEKARDENRVKQYPVAIHLHGDFTSLYSGDTVSTGVIKETKGNDLLVIGNSSFLTGSEVSHIFMKNMTDWLTTNDQLITIRNRTFVDRTFKTSSFVDERKRALRIRLVNILLMPALLIITGLIILAIRKNAQKNGGR